MIAFMKRQLGSYKKLVAATLLLQMAGNLLSLLLPTINKGIVDLGIANMDISYIAARGALMVVLSFVQIACMIAANITGAKTALSAGRDMREKMYARILAFSQKEVGKFGAPTLITRATSDVQQVTMFITYLFTSIISAPIMFIGGVCMALALDVSMAAVIFCMLPIFVLISVFFIKNVVPMYRTQQEKTDRLNTVMRDQISGVRVVKAFVKEEHEKERMEEVNGELSLLSLNINKLTSIIAPLFTFIVDLINIALVWYGGIRIERGVTEIGTVIAMITYASYILSAVMIATVIFIFLPRAEVSVGRIEEVLGTQESVREAENAAAPDTLEGTVRFEHVSFSHAPENPDVKPVLRDISFEAKPGRVTAVIGSTGCGKSTLLSLIARLMDATDGTVSIGGYDVRTLKKQAITECVGLVPQKAFLFSGTLEKNLRYGGKDASEAELWEALRIAQAEDFIKENKDGLGLRVSEGGSNFSGGQRQRLAIARVIARRPGVYLFDDSFSALDYSTDKKLRGELKKITGNATVIIVAQRVSTIRDADSIIVLDKGEIAGIGTHEELLRTCSVYQEIVKSQPTEEE